MPTSLSQKIFRILLGLVMVIAGMAHLTSRRIEFQAQVPRWLTNDPAFMDFIVVSSGIVEILLGLVMIFLIKHQLKAGIALAIFFVLIFPGNISQYTNGIDAFGMNTDLERLTRLFFQPILVIWALWATGVLKYLKRKS